jgi:hypothetical protein
MAQLHVTRWVAVFVLVLAGCATATRQQAERPEKAVAKVLAASAVGVVSFKDVEAAKQLAGGVAEVKGFQFAVIMGEGGAKLTQYVNADLSEKRRAVLGSLERRIKSGEKEFDFQQDGLFVSVVPIRRDELLIGYVAVATL